jgi:hypothetical protein
LPADPHVFAESAEQRSLDQADTDRLFRALRRHFDDLSFQKLDARPAKQSKLCELMVFIPRPPLG